MKKIFLCGLPHTGKGLMRPLLDGHPGIVTCPFGKFGMQLLTSEFQQFISARKVRGANDLQRLTDKRAKFILVSHQGDKIPIRVAEIMSLLISHTMGFSKLIDCSLTGTIRAASTPRKEIFVDFHCDYKQVIEKIEHDLIARSSLDEVEDLLDIFYRALIQEWRNLRVSASNDRSIVVSAPNKIGIIRDILKRTTNSQIIIMLRDIVGRTFTNNRRMQEHTELKNWKQTQEDLHVFGNPWFDYSPNLYSKNFIDANTQFRKQVYELKRTHSNIYIVDFDELIEKRESVMDSVADFLNLERMPEIYTATLNSVPLEGPERAFSGVVADDPKKYMLPVSEQFVRYLSRDSRAKISLVRRISFFPLSFSVGQWLARLLTGAFRMIQKTKHFHTRRTGT